MRHTADIGKQLPRHQRGLTLIEAVAATLLIGILAVIGSNFLSGSVVLSKRAASQNQNASAVRYAIDRISREIREVATSSSGYVISTMGSGQLVFTSASTQASGTKVTEFVYSSANKTLSMVQGGTGTPQPIVSNVTNFSFAYYDKAGQAMSSPTTSDVRMIGLTLQVQAADTPVNTYYARVYLRN